MAEGKLVVRFLEWWLVVLLVCGTGGVSGGEMRTVAYVVDRGSFDRISCGWLHWEPDDLDPFGELAKPTLSRFTKPIPLAEKPSGTRFFKDGDRMWLLTGHLRELRVLEGEGSWAVWNEETDRMVVHGTRREHGFVALLWDDLHHPWRMETVVELVKVRCRELGAVAWSAEEVRRRDGERLGSVVTTSWPGVKGSVSLQTKAGEVWLESESDVGSNATRVGLRIAYETAVRHPDGTRQLEFWTGMAVYSGHPVYVEVGGADGGEETYLVGVRVVPQFTDGTPRWQWREYEDESVREEPVGRPKDDYKRIALDDGMFLVRFDAWPEYVDDLSSDPSEVGDDPFAVRDEAGALERYKETGIRPVESLPEIAGYRKTDLLYDIGSVMKENGLSLTAGMWVYFNKTRCQVLAKVDEVNADLLDALRDGILDCGVPRMLHVTASVIEWSGECEAGRIPAGARRLARMGAVARHGQKVTMRHGWPADGLKRGVRFQVEPNSGADPGVLDLRVDLEVAGECPVTLSTKLVVTDGQPVVIPLGEEGGKKIGVVITGRVIDGTGAPMRPRE